MTATEALRIAIGHIEHMAAFITEANSDYHCGTYSFEGLGEDMPGIRVALALALPDGKAVAWREALEKSNEALNAVAEFMRKDVQSGDCALWTPEYEDLHDDVIVAREVVRRALASPPPASEDVRVLREALQIIADWQNVRIADEHEHSLRDIIRSITDCAIRALAPSGEK